MSQKFGKNRSVDYRYLIIPLRYTGIYHPNDSNKELVLVDDYKKHYLAAYRNHTMCKIGITFLLKKTEKGFIHKGKEYKHTRSGWVW